MPEDLVDSGGVLFGVVEREVEIGHAAKLQAFENFVTDETDRMFERLDGAFLLFFSAASSDEDTGVAAIGSEVGVLFMPRLRRLPWGRMSSSSGETDPTPRPSEG